MLKTLRYIPICLLSLGILSCNNKTNNSSTSVVEESASLPEDSSFIEVQEISNDTITEVAAEEMPKEKASPEITVETTAEVPPPPTPKMAVKSVSESSDFSLPEVEQEEVVVPAVQLFFPRGTFFFQEKCT